MTRTSRFDLPRGLDDAVRAVDVPPPAAVEQRAQQRLLARLRDARAPTRATPVRWWSAAAASVLATVLVAVPLFSDQGTAFAEVQAHFRDFDTLSMRVEQRFGGRLVQASRMVVDRQGVLRTDVGSTLSVIVDPVRGRVLTLQHGPRVAMASPIGVAGSRGDASLRWLEEIRDFRGEARQLEETRMMAGQRARGWTLAPGGIPLVLWVDDAGLPLAMETTGAGGLAISYRFAFDVPVPPGYLSSAVPAGYAVAEPDVR